MKLDSEEQRETLLGLLAQVPLDGVTFGNVAAASAEVDELLAPIRDAEIEDDTTDVLDLGKQAV